VKDELTLLEIMIKHKACALYQDSYHSI